MKRLKLLGEVLSKAQQKQIYGGYEPAGVTLYCQKADPNIVPCEIKLTECPASGQSKQTCENDKTCYDYTHSFTCGA